MAVGNEKTAEKNTETAGIERSLRDIAEEQLARIPERSADLKGQTAEELIHELQVHQIELEIQAEELKRAYLALEESRDRYLDLYDFAPLGYFTLSDKALIAEVNMSGATLLGVERSKLVKERFSKFIAEKDSDQWYRYFMHVRNTEGKQICTLTLIGGDGSTFPARLESIRITGKSDGTTTVRVAISDITDMKKAEEALITFSEDLERQVTERTSDLSDVNLKLVTEIGIRLDAEKQLMKTVGEKEVLLREVHHRVKNNLQIIISLLNLQSRYITDETTLSAFRESQSRVRAMALVHEKLYQSSDLAKIDFDNYIRFLGDSMLRFFDMKGKGITLTMDIRDIFLAIDTAIPIGLMINELISNSLKYAFPKGRPGEISIAIHRLDHRLTIQFKDNGIGIPEGFDWRNTKSMGLHLVITLADQLDGTIELDRGSGTAFTIVVKEKE